MSSKESSKPVAHKRRRIKRDPPVPTDDAPPTKRQCVEPLPGAMVELDNTSFTQTDIATMTEQCAHLRVKSSTKECLTLMAPYPTSSSSRSATTADDPLIPGIKSTKWAREECKRLHVAQSSVLPRLIQPYVEACAKLWRPVRFDRERPWEKLDQNFIADQIRTRHIPLELFGAHHESLLLMQAGPTQTPDRVIHMPPCLYGSECVASTYYTKIQGLTEPITLTEGMTRAEFRHLLETGEAPQRDRWPCILCHRKHLIRVVQEWRHLDELIPAQSIPESATTRVFVRRENPNAVHQLWYNLVDVVDGYHFRWMFFGNPQESIFAPLVHSSLSPLTAHKSDDEWRKDRWVIDQSCMIWSPPTDPVPSVGESLQHF